MRRVRFLTAGFNHQAFVLRFEQDGQSLYPKLAGIIESSPELRRVRVEIFRRFGYFPTDPSEHSAEFTVGTGGAQAGGRGGRCRLSSPR